MTLAIAFAIGAIIAYVLVILIEPGVNPRRWTKEGWKIFVIVATVIASVVYKDLQMM